MMAEQEPLPYRCEEPGCDKPLPNWDDLQACTRCNSMRCDDHSYPTPDGQDKLCRPCWEYLQGTRALPPLPEPYL